MEQEIKSKAETGNSTIPNPRSILIVEDSPVQAELLRHTLEAAGYAVLVAPDGVHGLALAEAHRPDVVISDINMPLMDGYQMCAAIRNNDALKSIPVILVTMLSDTKDVIHGLKSGADAYLTKPYNAHSLISRLESLLAAPVTPFRVLDRRKMEVLLDGERYSVQVNNQRMLNLLVSTYENAVLQNRELLATQQALEEINAQLETKVLEKTTSLNTEIVEHKVARQQLEQQLDELRRFKTVSIGREARMKELFDENQMLRERLQKAGLK